MQKSCCPCRVEIVEDLFGENDVLNDVLRSLTSNEEPRVVIVADANFVHQTEGIGSKIGRYFNRHSIKLVSAPVMISGGEKIKADNLQSANLMIKAFLEAQIGADDFVIAIGGGALLDVASYAASQVRGGIPIIKVPTTPAAMMDAAFASDGRVDLLGVKDALRISSKTAAILIQPDFSKTVLDGVWRGSASAAIQIAVAKSAGLLEKLEANAEAFKVRDLKVMEMIIREVVALRLSNGGTTLGEWAALRLEAISGYKLPRGYSLAIGVLVDLRISECRALVSAEDRARVEKVLNEMGSLDGLFHSRHLMNQIDAILTGVDAWQLSNGKKSFVLPKAIGEEMAPDELDREVALAALKNFFAVESGEKI